MNSKLLIDTVRDFVEKEPAVGSTLMRVESRVRPPRAGSPKQFTSPLELMLLPVLFPVLVYLVRHSLFPWLVEGTRYSELWRLRFRRWVDAKYQQAGVSPSEVKAAADALSRELEKIDDAAVRTAWERFAEKLRPIAEGVSSDADAERD